MRFVVQHNTLYRYSVPVVLAPHLLRLTPRSAGTHLLSRSLLVFPQPVSQVEEIDDFGNAVTRASFGDWPSDQLRIESRFELDTFAPAPISPSVALAPLPWPAGVNDDLAGYRLGRADHDPDVTAFAHSLAREVGHQPLAFLDHLCRTLYQRTDCQIRPTGDAQSAGQTLATRQGACRDLTVLFLIAARMLGFAARFCSGYQAAAQTADGQRDLHA